jgi:hypothetical protein
VVSDNETIGDNDNQPWADIHTLLKILVKKHTQLIIAGSVTKGKFPALICIL